MKNGQVISKKYALAFLNIFPFEVENLERIKEAIVFLDQHDELFLMLKIPLLDETKKSQALEGYLIERFKLPESFKHLIALLIVQKRSYIINDVLRWIVELYEEKEGLEFFEIETSIPLNESDVKTIAEFLAGKTTHTINTKQKQNNELIAGIRLQSGYHLWEYSIRKQLAAVHRLLKD